MCSLVKFLQPELISECIPAKNTVEEQIELKELSETVNRFLAELSVEKQQVFLRRYWYADSMETIAGKYGFTVSKVKSMLFHTREALREHLKICDFMKESEFGTYYTGDNFSAVHKYFESRNGGMWFILPEEGVTPEALLSDSQTMDFILSGSEWENNTYLRINSLFVGIVNHPV